jgi:L-ascorbate metabolism protein UlaG (beta-lactamase superfamily)
MKMGLAITYVGHATVVIELDGIRFVTDPILRQTTFGIIERVVAEPEPIEPPPDAILISHQHGDHLDRPSLQMLGTDVPVIGPRGSGRRLRRWGMKSTTELTAGDSTRIGSIDVAATPAVHDGRRYPIGPRLPFGLSSESVGYHLRGAHQRVYFAGDTDLFDEMSDLDGVDLALLPIGGWGRKVGEGHLDPVRAAKAAGRMRARAVVPIHWGTVLRAGLAERRPDLLTKHADELPARMAELAPESEVRILQPGESLTLAR